MFFDKLLKWF